MEVNKKSKAKLFIWPSLFLVLVVAASFLGQIIFENNYYQKFYVSGSSMNPTLVGDKSNADYGIYDGHDSALKNLKRFQIVTTYYPQDHSSLKIKRVLFKPGDTFEIVAKQEDNKLKHEMRLFKDNKSVGYRVLEFPFDTSHIKGEHTYPKTTLKDDEYFVAGDNWDNSVDSFDASVGPIPYKELVGLVIKVQGRCQVVDGKIENKQPYTARFFNGVDY